MDSWWLPAQVPTVFLARLSEAVCHCLLSSAEGKWLAQVTQAAFGPQDTTRTGVFQVLAPAVFNHDTKLVPSWSIGAWKPLLKCKEASTQQSLRCPFSLGRSQAGSFGIPGQESAVLCGASFPLNRETRAGRVRFPPEDEAHSGRRLPPPRRFKEAAKDARRPSPVKPLRRLSWAASHKVKARRSPPPIPEPPLSSSPPPHAPNSRLSSRWRSGARASLSPPALTCQTFSRSERFARNAYVYKLSVRANCAGADEDAPRLDLGSCATWSSLARETEVISLSVECIAPRR